MSAIAQPHFQNDDAAFTYLEAIRWPHGTVCPHCGTIGTAYVTSRAHVYRCAEKGCRKDFTVRVGTVFESSRIPLYKFLLAAYLVCASKKGISSKQIERMLGVTYKTAWFMTHRLREAMNSTATGKLGGSAPVEADETYWGNVGKNNGQRGYEHKMKIVSLVERNGEKRSFHVANVTAKTLRPILNAHISGDARLMTDQASVYTKLGHHFASHESVNHTAGEYARGDVTTNTVESSFAILKRGLYGTFHSVSEKHLPRYLGEFDFRWNTRQSLGFNDTDRMTEALKGVSGKRLTYRRLDS
jgi:transposase-like protein